MRPAPVAARGGARVGAPPFGVDAERTDELLVRPERRRALHGGALRTGGDHARARVGEERRARGGWPVDDQPRRRGPHPPHALARSGGHPASGDDHQPRACSRGADGAHGERGGRVLQPGCARGRSIPPGPAGNAQSDAGAPAERLPADREVERHLAGAPDPRGVARRPARDDDRAGCGDDRPGRDPRAEGHRPRRRRRHAARRARRRQRLGRRTRRLGSARARDARDERCHGEGSDDPETRVVAARDGSPRGRQVRCGSAVGRHAAIGRRKRGPG